MTLRGEEVGWSSAELPFLLQTPDVTGPPPSMTWVPVDQVCEYGDPQYWDQKYQKEDEVTEWFFGYEPLKPVFEKLLKPSSRILMLGCGNSTLSADMYAAGYHHITNIDISASAIEKMQSQYAHMSGMQG